MDNIETNKKIAIFNGFQYFPHNSEENIGNTAGWRTPIFHHKIKGTYLCRSHNDLPYDKDLTHLFQTVDKIKNKGFEVDIRITSERYFCNIYNNDYTFINSSDKNLLEAVYKCVAEFVNTDINL
jgi:hypothetical protein